jgi:hypothetical protein
VNCKHRRNKRAAPERTCHFSKYKKKQDHGEHVQQNVTEVVPPSLQPKKLAIQHV